MKVDTDIKHLAIVVALAVLIPFAVRSGVKTFMVQDDQESSMVDDQTGLYIAGGIGIVCMIIGSQIAVQAVGSGIFVGGLVTLIKAIKCSWADMDPVYRFALLVVGILVALFFGLRGNMSLKNVLSNLKTKRKRTPKA